MPAAAPVEAPPVEDVPPVVEGMVSIEGDPLMDDLDPVPVEMPESSEPTPIDWERFEERVLERLAADPVVGSVFSETEALPVDDPCILTLKLFLTEPEFARADTPRVYRLAGIAIREVSGAQPKLRLVREDPPVEERIDQRPDYLKNPTVATMLELFNADVQEVRQRKTRG